MHLCNTKNISIKEILKISLPMMISALSSHLMIILDQLVLAYYSVEAMTGATSASLWSAALQCAAMSTTMIAGVFVGHYNGSKQFKLAGIPVWQMIWFSIALFAISIPVGLFMGETLIPENIQKEGLPYFKILMSCTPLTGIIFSLSAFFVSIGRGFIVTIAVIIANIVNIAANIIFVFGYFGIDWFVGSTGAAIGTVISWIINIIILGYFFLSHQMREKYGTLNFKLRTDHMKKYLKLGAVGGIGHSFEMTAWSFLYYTLAGIAKEAALIQTMAFSVNIFLSFIVSGLEKGILAITSNLLGSKLEDQTRYIIKKGLTLHFIFAGILFFIFYFFPEFISDRFIKFKVSQETLDQTYFVLKLVWIYFVLDGCAWVIAGVIEAGGDINYTMWTITTCLWVFVGIPTYFICKYSTLTIETIWMLLIVEALSVASVLYCRYKSKKWIHIRI